MALLSVFRIKLTILGTRNHPFAFAVKCDSSDVSGVTFECKYSRRIGAFDIVELDGVAAGCGEEAFVGRDAQSVDLGIGVRYRTGANTTKGFPETGNEKF